MSGIDKQKLMEMFGVDKITPTMQRALDAGSLEKDEMFRAVEEKYGEKGVLLATQILALVGLNEIVGAIAAHQVPLEAGAMAVPPIMSAIVSITAQLGEFDPEDAKGITKAVVDGCHAVNAAVDAQAVIAKAQAEAGQAPKY